MENIFVFLFASKCTFMYNNMQFDINCVIIYFVKKGIEGEMYVRKNND